MENADTIDVGSFLLDVVNAVGVNIGALVVGYPLAIFGPGILMFIVPGGVFWAYILLVGWYAVFQFRKGRRRRAVLACAIVAVVLIVFARGLRIA